jgi:hypothetical protein
MKVSFDFDGTLEYAEVQRYAKELIDRGFEVWIVTARVCDKEAPNPTWNEELHDIRKVLGIPLEHVEFRAYTDKADFFLEHDFLWHLDDDLLVELAMMEYKQCVTKGIHYHRNVNWKEQCETLIKSK